MAKTGSGSDGYKAAFVIEGTTPLLMHRDNIEGGDEVKVWQKDRKNKNQSVPGDDRTPPWVWTKYLYENGESVTMPQENVMAAIMSGGAQLSLKGAKTYKELSQSAVFLHDRDMLFEYRADESEAYRQLSMAFVNSIVDLKFTDQSNACEAQGFTLFCKRAKVNNAKHVRVRPRFAQWRVSGSLTVIGQDLPFDKLEAIFEYAGRAGLGDWRPSSPKRPGAYGMFHVTLEVIK